MFQPSYKYFLAILLYALSFSSEYSTLYLMEFENSSKDYRTDNYRIKFPELIKHKYSNRDFEISYAPNLLSSLTTEDEVTKTLKDGILLYGKFNTSYENVIISLEAYDVNNWEKKSSRDYRCRVDDIECIENAFFVCIEENVLTLFCDNYDCLGVCNGSALIDCEGKCNGTSILDCNENCNGNFFINECNQCVRADNNVCKQDCNEDWGGEAFYNECGICIQGNTGKELDEGKDCFGKCGGMAQIDCYEECNGSALPDCNGECQGSAFFNECNVCVGGSTRNTFNQGLDCAGVCFGSATIDDCGICNGNNLSCSDCTGDPYGTSYEDNCGTCDSNPSNDCVPDCNGDWGGTAFLNECLVCVEGETEINQSAGLDCANICWGISQVDECGVCNGPGDIYNCGCEEVSSEFCDCYGHVKDCLGVCGGVAVNDLCGVCNGDGNSCNNEQLQNKDMPNNKDVGTGASLVPLLNKLDININTNDLCIDCEIISGFDLKQNNTDKFLYIVDSFFKNPYNVFIDDMEIEQDDNMIHISVPIQYSIKNELFETIFSNLAHQTKANDNGTFTIDLLKNDFNIEPALEDYFSLMKYQIIPVLFFYDSNNEIKHIHVDSWNNDYNFLPIELNESIELTISNNFYPLFSITPNEDVIQINLDLNNHMLTYGFTFKLNDFKNYNYTNLSVQFFYENDIEMNINSYANNR